MDSSPVARLAAALAGRYTLERELGRGGMATVWLASDLKHDRAVALKVLRPELAAALGPERFVREITLTAGLDHPHILPLLDSGEAGGFLYYTMPFVEGESLRDRLTREQQLPLEDALQITREVADALGYAHSRGVVHRDVKPENILLAGGHARVADFGIATALTVAGGARLTETGIAVGTPAYMSPEQGAGSRELDGRSDLYSLGCVLYEMLAGHPPFTGATAREVLARHSLDAVPGLTAARPTVPAHVERAIQRALAKVPADRYTTTPQFIRALTPEATEPARRRRMNPIALRFAIGSLSVVLVGVGLYGITRWRPGTPAIRTELDPNAVAVFPFRVSAVDPTLAAMGQGVMDLLHAHLTGDVGPRAVTPDELLRVWNRIPPERRERDPTAPLEVAVHFRAGRLLEGSIVQAGSQMTISAWLRQIPSGDEQTRQSVTGPPDSLVALTASLATRLLGAQLGESEERLRGLGNQDPVAVRSYLAGLQAWREGRRDDAVRSWEAAARRDSSFALVAFMLATRGASLSSDEEAAFVRKRLQATRWARRFLDELSARDRAALLVAILTARVDTVPTGAALLDAARRWADLAPDDPSALAAFALFLDGFGAMMELPHWRDEYDELRLRSWQLDSTTPDRVITEVSHAITGGDSVWLRRVAPVFLTAVDTTADSWAAWRWVVAHVQGDSAVVRRLRQRLDAGDASLVADPGGWAAWILIVASFTLGIPPDDGQRIVRLRQARVSGSYAAEYHDLFDFPSGRLRRASDSLLRIGSRAMSERLGAADATNADTRTKPWFPWIRLIERSFTDPGLDSVAGLVADSLEVAAGGPARGDLDAECFPLLHRAARGDTVGVRATARGLAPRFQRGFAGVCPAMVEALVEGRDTGRAGTAALDTLEAVMRRTAPYPTEFPAGIAMLLVARLHRQRGTLDRALRAIRDSYGPRWALGRNYRYAYLKEEGEIALLVGDTAAAVRAFEGYLRYRVDPDPGPLRAAVDSLRAQVARLTVER